MKRILSLIVVLMIFVSLTQANQNNEWTGALQKALNNVDHLEVYLGSPCEPRQESQETLVSANNPTELQKLIESFDIDPEKSGPQSSDCGEAVLKFNKGKESVVTLGFYDGDSIHWHNGKWSGNAILTNESATFLRNWLAQNGITGPAANWYRHKHFLRDSTSMTDQWLAVMPSELKNHLTSSNERITEVQFQKLVAELNVQFPESNARILALLSWYGSGEGPWFGYRTYESLVEELLLEHTTPQIVSAVEDTTLTHEQTEGLARLLGRFNFDHQRPGDLYLVPYELKINLLAHCLRSKDPDIQFRAQNVFGGTHTADLKADNLDTMLDAVLNPTIPKENQAILSDLTRISEQDAEKAMKAVMTFLKSPELQSEYSNTVKMYIYNALKNYTKLRVQFISIKEDGQKRILCNFFPGLIDHPKWKTDEVQAEAGGALYWRISYDPVTDKCLNFRVQIVKLER